MVPFKTFGTVSYLHSTVTMALSCITPEIKQDIGRKSIFSYPPLHLTPSLPMFGWYRKTRMEWLSNGEKA